ncbi:L,D-transpeptidase family protein [Spongiactinospora sp. 9N601]|uniref:L,D-transpeptidase family protein n=1 Tax=Spongiactinospora sp. 9N601 TaxID=3375149 RepID=UPI0037ACEA5B
MGAAKHLGLAACATAAALLIAGCGLSGSEPVAGPAPRAVHAEFAGAPSAGAAAGLAAGRAEPAPFTAPGKTLRLGAKGKVVKVLQARLKELGYHPGKIDGQYGGGTQFAVWAFQKVNGIRPTSTIARRTWNALEDPKAPKVLARRGKATRVEINLTQQVMVLYVGGEPKLISHTSSGSGIAYCETTEWQGKKQRFCGDARTPTGDYKTTWRKSGWHKSYLGQLYNPIFFNGGIAVHGALSVPLAPASHGCVRLPMHVAKILPAMLGKGVPVHVRGKFRR